jgi:hypothetical protein
MRKLIGILFLLSFLPVVAQENVIGEYMYIYHRDKSVERIDISDIDSITFTVPQIVYEAVDLGLSVKWAACNVGALSPWESGGYYAWGETEEKESYDWNTYKYCNGTQSYITKYCTNPSYGNVDGKTALEPEDDVAHVERGGSWRMPTTGEMSELMNKCTWTWTKLNGVSGYRITGPSGNSIFIPITGYRYGTAYNGSDVIGYFWSRDLIMGNEARTAYHMNYVSEGFNWSASLARSAGLPVRPVCEAE